MTNNGDIGEEIKNSSKEYVAAAERDFMWHTRPPKDHFEKILEGACPHHPYPIKHKLRDYSWMKKFLTSGAPPGSDEQARDSRGKGTMLILREVEVTTLAG
jgi:hypothetical protein